MKILVTGGAGFIGSAVVRHLLNAVGAEVVTLDALTYAGHRETLSDLEGHERHEFLQADIRDRAAVSKVFARHRPDAVIHLAAESHVDRSIDRPLDFVSTNVNGTVTLLEAALEYWRALEAGRRETFRFLHVSTDEVYGSLGSAGKFTEDSIIRPNSPYAASKAASDFFVRAWHRTYGLPVLISHCSNNYGPFQLPEKFIPVVILAAIEGREIPVYGDGRNVRDWIYVEDHAEGLWAILERGKPGETYNLGGNAESANLDVARRLCRCLDELVPESTHRPHEELIRFVADRPGHDWRYAIDTRKAEAALSWQPKTELTEGLGRTVRWYLENRWWWEGVRDGGFEEARIGLGRTATGIT
jgi:dTDP-glucose 4,6-dehydratase